jgi:tetratricopeptide (TPR) repeat protein
MEKKPQIMVLVLLLLFSSILNGNDRFMVYNAYVMNDMPAWKRIIDRLQKQEKKSNEFLLSLVNYQFGYIGWCIGKENEQEAESYIAQVRENLAALEKNRYNMSMVYAYKSALYGYEIGLNTFRAPFIGPKSFKYAELALKLDSENYFAWVQFGNIQYYMPSIFGGSTEEALRCFLKAKNLMEKNRDLLIQDWNYLHLLTLIAQAYSDLKDYQSAQLYYETLLKIEPRFQWVRDELYSRLLQHFKN